MQNKQLGQNGEDIAEKFLTKQGYKILERNRHFSRYCEIDIIAQFKKKIIFVEVKTRRTNSFGSPLEAITKRKYENIKTGVLSYLKEHKIKDYQIDAIGITMEPEPEIKHLKNV